jgi:phage terminase large subunit-like protein
VLKSFASLRPAQQRLALRAAAKASGIEDIDALRAVLLQDWRVVGRPKQQPPPGDWTYWMLRCGRGFGKTITGAQWAKRVGVDDDPGCRFKLVAPTQSDVRKTMVEGETGLLSVLPAAALLGQSRETAWNTTKLELTLANGTTYEGYSSEKPDRMRGPQHGYAWCEEISSWKDANKGDELDTTWSNVKLSTRLGRHPRTTITSTPKANKLTRALLAIPGIVVVSGSSYENRDNLSEVWWREVVAPYEGTRLGRQEIHGEVLGDVEGALWTMALLDQRRADRQDADWWKQHLHRIGVGVDPNASSDEAANAAGIVVAGVDGRQLLDRKGYVLDDRTITRGGPRAWAQAAVDAYHEWQADFIVAEKNNGGEMVELMMKTVDPTVPVKLVSAARGKRTRAEPIASIYAGSDAVPGRAFHAGVFPELEDEMTTWTPEADSPDRMDALVWVLSELMLGKVPGHGRSGVPQGRVPDTLERRTIGR